MVQIGIGYQAISTFSLIFFLILLAFVASGPSLLFPESCFYLAPLLREWDIY